MRRCLVPIAILLIPLLILGCTGNSKLYNKYQGTDGLVFSFAQYSPPDEVYEDRPFPVNFELHNAGAENVSYGKLVVLFSADPLYINTSKGILLEEDLSVYDSGLRSYDPKHKAEILGRSEVYPNGERRSFGIPTDVAFAAKPIMGQRESPEAEITASACYAYKTFAAASVCIDTNIYQQNLRQQSCKQQDVTLTGGQGAPIAVTLIEVQALPVISKAQPGSMAKESVRPQFIIHIEDTGYGTGKGYLVGPDTLDIKNACILKSIPRDQVNAVVLRANLLKTTLICGQGAPKDTAALVRLEQGKATVTCTVPENDITNPIYSSTQNFLTTVSINISYIYKTSTTKKVTIKRLLGSRDLAPTGDESGKVAGYAYEGDSLILDSEGRPMEWCQYYQQKPDAIPSELRAKGFATRVKELQSMNPPREFNCACTRERCDALGKGVNCFDGLCATDNSKCCTDPLKTRSTSSAGSGTSGSGTGTGSGTGSGGITDSCYAGDLGIPKIGPNPTKQQINDALEAAANKYGIPPDVLKAVAYQENRGWATNVCGDDGRSCGLMQINTGVWTKYNKALGNCEVSYNIDYGAKILHDNYSGDWRTAVRKYNGSGSAAERYADSVMNWVSTRPWISAFGVH
jgi:hypothetical protein